MDNCISGNYYFLLPVARRKLSKMNLNAGKLQWKTLKTFLRFSPSDTDFFMGALSCLGDAESENDYQAAREQLEVIVQKYPKSKWKESAQALIRIIHNLGELKMNFAAEKKKSAADESKIEELKNDIQRLKNLEIQLDKREKKLK